jgi:NAD(P)-dependent dehydrogenase (short-subunit alcohol dehydrogenase family)
MFRWRCPAEPLPFRVKILLILNIFARFPALNGLCLLLIQEKNMNVNGPDEAGLALVIGAGGGLGAALVAGLLQPGPRGQAAPAVLALGRLTTPVLDYADEATLAGAARWLADEVDARRMPLRTLIVASGYLHGVIPGQPGDRPAQPERSGSHLDPAYLAHCFAVNAIGPALVVKHFFPLLARTGPCVAGFISAKVGSIGDNALGGWYGYRASKAALNQIVRTAAIELARRNRRAVCVALHPGTVDTPLSQPFAKAGLTVRSPSVAAGELLAVLHGLTPAQSGGFFDYRGQALPW